MALKFVSEELSRDPEALSRFAREAQTASALNHTNICTIHDIGEQDGRSFIVMEYLEGTTLKDRLAAGSMSLHTVLDVGIQIADALDAAHTAGIIHRDIKPANVFIGSRDRVKVLDFGLAKMRGPATHQADMTTMAGTRQGVVMGTVAYMAPEQARGEMVDHRADIWSFGVVLYEMATGTRPAPGVRLRVEGTPELERIISKCLETDRELRYQHTADLRTDLERLRRGHGERWRSIRRSRAAARFGSRSAPPSVIAAAVAGTIDSRRPATLTDKDTIVLAEFTNRTGDPVFDETLRQGLAVQLQQSPFLSLISEERIRKNAVVDEPAAGCAVDSRRCAGRLRPDRERRRPGWIDRVARKSVRPRSAREALHHRRQARRRAGAGGTKGRGARAHSARWPRGFGREWENRSPPSRSTRSHSRKRRRRRSKPGRLSAPHRSYYSNGAARRCRCFERAVEIDLSLRWPMRGSGSTTATWESRRSRERALRKAYRLRHRASDVERFYIDTLYDREVTGNVEREQRTMEAWARNLPARYTLLTRLLAGFARAALARHELSIA